MKSKAIAFWLSFFLGALGIHRFYLGKPLTGVLWFFTTGLFGFGYIFDVIFIAFDVMKDGNKQRLRPPGVIHDIIIKILAVLFVISLISLVYFVAKLAIYQPDHPFFKEFPSIPGTVDV